jgi:hypothetical protein
MKRFASTLLLALGTPLMFTACATMGPPQPPSLQLPKPPSDLRATRKGNRVILIWTLPRVTTDRKTIQSEGPTRICRGLEPKLTQCGISVGEAAPQASASTSPSPAKSGTQKISASYTDSLPAELLTDNPPSFITFGVEALNEEGRGAGLSNQVQVPLIRTLPPPPDFAARVTGQGVVLTWTNQAAASSAQTLRYRYRIYRRREGSQEKILAGEIGAGNEPTLTLTDASIEWEKTYEYRAEAVTVIAQDKHSGVKSEVPSELQIEGDDTPEVKVFTDDVFPPAVPSGLQAVFSGPGQQAFIDLVWAPVADVDLDGYNVYRHEEGMAAVKVNAGLVKTPAYRDMNVVSGKRYVYSVSAVDVRGNESTRSEEAGEAVP